MIIYTSPRSGKTTFCNYNPEWIDADVILFSYLNDAFKCDIKDDNRKGDQIIRLFNINRVRAEKCYTRFMEWLKINKYSSNIMLGTRRFMWLADIVFIKDHEDLNITLKEVESAKKWNIKYIQLKSDEYINLKLIFSLINN